MLCSLMQCCHAQTSPGHTRSSSSLALESPLTHSLLICPQLHPASTWTGDAQVLQGLQNSGVQEVAGESGNRGVGTQNLASHLGGTRQGRWCEPPPSRRGPVVLNAPAPSPYCGKSCCIHHCQAPSLNKFECTEPWAAVSIISLSSLNISLTFFFSNFFLSNSFSFSSTLTAAELCTQRGQSLEGV